MFHPDASLMSGAPWIYQAHTLSTFVLFALWPFSRLVHVWTAPVHYVTRRAHILYRGSPATTPS
jgi:nitrate reductase gamma subunit